MNTTEKAIVVGLGLVVAIGLFAGAAYGFVGQTSAASQKGGAGMISGGSSYGGGGMTGSGGMIGLMTNGATSSQSHSGGMMGGLWGMMGNHGLVTSGSNFFMGCIQYMAHYLGLGANGAAS